jgi:hypothetical protein
LDLTGGEKSFIGKPQCLQEKWVDEGRESQPQWWHLVVVDGSRHGKDFTTFCYNLVGPVENELARGSRRDAITSATDEYWKPCVLFERSNLLTHCWLRSINPLGSLGEVPSFIDGKQIYKMAKLYGI